MAGLSGRGKQKRTGGYDCEFVEPPPEIVQSDCPICLQILKEPCLISCPCGTKFCRECVELIKKGGKPCPMCNKSEFTFIRDHGLERLLRELKVWCSHKMEGCIWTGELSRYEQHLNEYPTLANELEGCNFVEVLCRHEGCGKSFRRASLAMHQSDECPKRPFSCWYCWAYNSTYENVTERHHPKCEKYPLPCPNKCSSMSFEREKIETHLTNECPLTEVQCPLLYAGCGVKLPRKDLAEHMKDTATHMTLLASITQRLLTDNQVLQHSVQDLRHTIQNLRGENRQLKEYNEELGSKIDRVIEETHQMKLTMGLFPIDFVIKHPNKNENHFLPSFFTRSYPGYRMCIRVDHNGYGDGKGTHVSLFIHMMKGLYDHKLKWPFRGDITIGIINQLGDHNHVVKTISFHDKTPTTYARRVTDKDRADNGWGRHKFLAHNDLEYNAINNTQYVKDGIIIVRVISIS